MTRESLSHLRDLAENLNDWEEYIAATPLSRFTSDRQARHALLHCVIVCLQAAIDTANHWAAGLTAERPESYRGIIELLEADKAIPSRLAKDLKGLFSLRNVLIHKYADLDLARLHGHLRRGSAPMRAFLKLAKAQVRPAA